MVPSRPASAGMNGGVQTPSRHVSPAWHCTSHAPQWRLSVSALTQTPSHLSFPIGQPDSHLPLLQVFPGPHVSPQRPQFRGSVAVATHAPLHAVSAAAHVGVHVPFWQSCCPPHALSQAPQ